MCVSILVYVFKYIKKKYYLLHFESLFQLILAFVGLLHRREIEKHWFNLIFRWENWVQEEERPAQDGRFFFVSYFSRGKTICRRFSGVLSFSWSQIQGDSGASEGLWDAGRRGAVRTGAVAGIFKMLNIQNRSGSWALFRDFIIFLICITI